MHHRVYGGLLCGESIYFMKEDLAFGSRQIIPSSKLFQVACNIIAT